MRYVNMFTLLASVAAVLMTLAGTASATTVTSSTGSTPTIHAVTPAGVPLDTHNGVGTVTCDSTLTMQIQSHGAGTTVKGSITTWSFTNCTGGAVHVTNAQGHLASPGSVEFHPAAATGNAIGTLTGTRITKTTFGVECGYETNGTKVGELVGGEKAVLKVSATITRTHGSFFCGSTGNLTGEFIITHPADLTFH